MVSWVYIFSKFTHEALLFEVLGFFFLCAGYTAFWIMKKRRLGVAGNEIPSYLVKGYLSQLILDAEQMRAQLFGLLGGGDISSLRAGGLNALIQAAPQFSAAPAGVSGDANNPAFAAQIAQLEMQMAQQAHAMQAVVIEKKKMERDLEIARAAGSAPAGGSSGGSSANDGDKIKLLEARLAEYSIIEDDLANLKRLQQENTQLRAALAGQGGNVAAVTAAAASMPLAAARATPAAPAAVAEAPNVEEPADPIQEPAIAAAAPDDVFEALVDQVEQSLQPAAAAAAAPAPAPAPAEEAAIPANQEKSDADLVAEFEKMLNA